MTSKNCCVYAILLDAAEFSQKDLEKFKEANPQWAEDMPAYYIGRSSKSPEERFKNHKDGYKASRMVKKYGDRVEHHMCELGLTYEESVEREKQNPDEERKLGIGIWSH